jgi:hypothetical protein
MAKNFGTVLIFLLQKMMAQVEGLPTGGGAPLAQHLRPRRHPRATPIVRIASHMPSARLLKRVGVCVPVAVIGGRTNVRQHARNAVVGFQLVVQTGSLLLQPQHHQALSLHPAPAGGEEAVGERVHAQRALLGTEILHSLQLARTSVAKVLEDPTLTSQLVGVQAQAEVQAVRGPVIQDSIASPRMVDSSWQSRKIRLLAKLHTALSRTYSSAMESRTKNAGRVRLRPFLSHS